MATHHTLTGLFVAGMIALSGTAEAGDPGARYDGYSGARLSYSDGYGNSLRYDGYRSVGAYEDDEPGVPYSPRRKRYRSYKDDSSVYAPSYSDQANSDVASNYSRYGNGGCLNKHQIRRKLISHGWSHFHNLRLVNTCVAVTARRPNGLVYRIQVDRCDGVILKARLLN